MSRGNKGGAPLGNKNAAKGHAWSEAIKRIIEAWPASPTKEGKSNYIIGLEAMAYLFVQKMIDSKDISFFKEFGDRLEGKPAQTVDLGNSDPERGLVVSVNYGKTAVVPVPLSDEE